MSSLLVREFSHELELRGGDGRTVWGRAVPYNQVAEIIDPQTFAEYREQFVRGVFAGAASSPEKVIFQFTHVGGFANTVGWGERIEERDDGLYGTFRLTEADAGKARELLENSHKSLSVGFYPLKSTRTGGIVTRVKAFLEHVAAVPTGAYADAGVLAVRNGTSTPVNDAPEVPDEAPRLEEVQAYLEKIKNGSAA